MKYLTIFLFVIILTSNNTNAVNKGSLNVFANETQSKPIEKILINDTVIIAYSFEDSVKLPGTIRISNANYSTDIEISKATGAKSFIFYKDVTNFNPEKQPVVSVKVSLMIENEVVAKKMLRLVYIPFELLSVSRQPIERAQINEKVYVKSNIDCNLSGKEVYFNEVPINKLRTESSEKNLYYFILYDRLANSDSLSKIFNLKYKGNINVAVSIGDDLENAEIVSTKFKLVFDENRGRRKSYSIISFIIIGLLTLYVLFKNKASILRDRTDAIDNPPFSLSRTQMAFWTIIIIIAFFVVWYNTGKLINITNDVLILLGISAGTTLGANLIDHTDIKNPNIKRHQDTNDSNNFLLNILSDSKGLSIHRFQNVIFTIAIGCYFLYEVFKEYRIPNLDSNLMILMGISSGTYLAIKKGENEVKDPGESNGSTHEQSEGNVVNK